jgi:hypothetical protein
MGCQRYVNHCRDWHSTRSTDPFFFAFRFSDKRSGDLARGSCCQSFIYRPKLIYLFTASLSTLSSKDNQPFPHNQLSLLYPLPKRCLPAPSPQTPQTPRLLPTPPPSPHPLSKQHACADIVETQYRAKPNQNGRLKHHHHHKHHFQPVGPGPTIPCLPQPPFHHHPRATSSSAP